MGDEISVVMGLSSVISQRLCRSEKIPDGWKNSFWEVQQAGCTHWAQHFQEWEGNCKVESKLTVETENIWWPFIASILLKLLDFELFVTSNSIF